MAGSRKQSEISAIMLELHNKERELMTHSLTVDVNVRSPKALYLNRSSPKMLLENEYVRDKLSECTYDLALTAQRLDLSRSLHGRPKHNSPMTPAGKSLSAISLSDDDLQNSAETIITEAKVEAKKAMMSTRMVAAVLMLQVKFRQRYKLKKEAEEERKRNREAVSRMRREANLSMRRRA
mmetsp:Transcript_20688/g.57426  ORF Transcript_20688/g.57426 Transcript_20688/m.57426 type:complete len:180 (+) Transcript_20688:305-844(+)